MGIWLGVAAWFLVVGFFIYISFFMTLPAGEVKEDPVPLQQKVIPPKSGLDVEEKPNFFDSIPFGICLLLAVQVLVLYGLDYLAS